MSDAWSRIIITALILVIAAGKVSAEASDRLDSDLAVSALYFSPADDDVYKHGFGAEVQGRFWLQNYVGLAIAGGLSSWETEDENIMLSSGVETLDISTSGSMMQLPLGGSVLFRPQISEKLSIVLEGGFRYVVVSSNVDADIVYSDGVNTFQFSETIDADNGFVGIIGAEFDMFVSESISILVGAGYQFDIAKGDIEFEGIELAENELEAAFIRVGIAVSL